MFNLLKHVNAWWSTPHAGRALLAVLAVAAAHFARAMDVGTTISAFDPLVGALEMRRPDAFLADPSPTAGSAISPRILVTPREAVLVGAPTATGQRRHGVERGPAALRAAGLVPALRALGWRVRDAGDAFLPSPPEPPAPHAFPSSAPRGEKSNAWASPRAAAKHAAVADAVEAAARAGAFPLVLGGDHSVAIGSIAGLLRARPNLRVLWIDAHADLNTPGISPSGNLHGMALALLANLASPDELALARGAYDWLRDNHTDADGVVVPAASLTPARFAHVGLRDVDDDEASLMSRLGARFWSADDVRSRGAAAVVDDALDWLYRDGANAPLHISLDVDVLDPELMRATGTRVPGGLTVEDVVEALDAARARGAVSSADIVELNVELADDEDDAEAFAETAAKLAAAILGDVRGM